ncbi:MAG: prephenate dehydrogenase/arogenate dehydrogenase family protein [Akkermansiaceae bacterium]|nr:prephenate dehydrogenase/arogenate dehydrogenase family protein [Akkermansiaceae bacterium]
MTEFHRIAILGPGLLGGSVGLAVRKRHPEFGVTLWGRSPERVAEIRSAGFEHVTHDLALAVKDAELIILAVPVGAMEELGARLLEVGVAPGTFVTDVGSVKVHPHQSLGQLMRERGIAFIGSHPMAGSERSGFDSAHADLFEGAPCILTNENELSDEDVNRLVGFWAGLGARAAIMSAEEHDRLVARISHLPHVLAVVCALVALEEEGAGNLAGRGLRDTSRVAAGDPLMWTEILLENRHEIIPPLRESASVLERLADLLEGGKSSALTTVLEEARERRQRLKTSG